jgi:DNA-binding MarR family transcriptional regulator
MAASSGSRPTDRPHPRTITSAAELKAMTHPLRQRIVRHLSTHGPATSTTLAQVLGENTGTTSYHLRQLERFGFIEEIPERSTGRERWWRSVPLDLRRPDRSTLSDEVREIFDRREDEQFANDLRLFLRLREGQDGDLKGWVQGSRAGCHMTAAELAQFHEAYLELLDRFGHGPQDAPAGSRVVALRFFAVPDEGDDAASAGEPDEPDNVCITTEAEEHGPAR